MDRVFEAYMGKIFSTWVQDMTKRRIDWICSRVHGSVLDVGCSQGLIPLLLATQKGLSVHGVDMDAEAITWAKAHIAIQNKSVHKLVRFSEMDFSDFPEDNTFDTIIAGEYIEHLTDEVLQEHLEKIVRLLKPTGIFICTTPLGIHLHPDHHQTFFPENLFAILDKYFNVLLFDVEDAYFRCICSKQGEHKKLSSDAVIALYKKGISQLQQRYMPKKYKTASPEKLSTTSSVNSPTKAQAVTKQASEQLATTAEMYFKTTLSQTKTSSLTTKHKGVEF